MSRTAPWSSRAAGESSRLSKIANPRRLLSAFLQIVVLAVNLFGWTLVPVSEASARPSAEMLSAGNICEHSADPQSGHDGSGHDKMVCPACFPLGNASSGALARIFEAGIGEFIKGKAAYTASREQLDVGAVLDGARRAMRAAFQREMDVLEAHLAFLASVGSVSPYIGLLGTVWGIMNAFRGLANVQQATLAAVAPGIAEALIATAIGLFAAIPAVIAYNRFASNVDRLAIRYESFMEEFTNILQRKV